MRDLVVAGGGPIGLAAALNAARAGLDVVVWEPRDGVIDKACGEGLMPGALALLEELAVRPPGRALSGIAYVDGRHRAVAHFREAPGRGVRRTVLHEELRRAVEAAGIEVVPRAVRSLTAYADHVEVDGEAARYVLGADGLHSSVRRLAGLEAASHAPRRFGLRAHLQTAPWSDLVEVHWSRHAEAYVTPVADDLVGVAVLTSRRGPLEQHLAGIDSLAPHLDGLSLVAPRGAGPLRQRSRRRVRGRVLLVGDAAGYVDALTGEGIASGLAQARAAVAAVVANDPEGYEREWRRLTRRHDLLTKTLLTSTRSSAVRAHIVASAARLPRVFDAAVNQLARPA